MNGSLQVEEILPNSSNKHDLLLFLKDNKQNIDVYLAEEIEGKKPIKWSLTIPVRFKKYNKDGEEIESEPPFNSLTIMV